MRYLLPVLIFLVITFSCNKHQEDDGSNPVEIYLLSTVQLVTNKCEIDGANSTIEATPLVRNQDIVAYYKSDYEFKLTDEAIQKIKALHDNTPFAVTVNKEVIYYAFFKPNFSSSSCFHSITMDVNWTTNTKIMMRLGYPGQLQGVTIEDRRNDPVLLAALAGHKKLK